MSSSGCAGHGSVVVDAGDAGWLEALGVKVVAAPPITGEFARSERCVSSAKNTKNEKSH